MSLIIRKEENPGNWDQELAKTGGSIFLSQVWLDALKAEDRIPVYFTFKRNNNVEGMLAGLERPVRNSSLKQLFFYSGIACDTGSPELLRECKSALLEYAKNNGYARVIIKSYDETNFIPAETQGFKKFNRAEFVVDLNRSAQEIEIGFAKNVKRVVKKAKAGGVLFKKGNSEQLLDNLFELLNTTLEIRSSKGYGEYNIFSMPFMDRGLMLKLLQNGDASLFYTEYLGEIVSMQFTITSFKRGYALFMGTNEKGYSVGAPTVLWHEIIYLLRGKGIISFNMGGIPLGEKNIGLERFKRSLGAKPVKSSEEFTNFLISPLKRLNIFLVIKEYTLKISIPWKVKKFILDFLQYFLKNSDEY